MSLTVVPTTATIGDVITFSAIVTGHAGTVPTGTVTFVDGVTGNTLASAALDTSGNASATATLAPGIYTVTANYPGDTTYNSNVSDEQDLTVNAKPASVALTASSTVASAGDSISLSATVAATGGSPSGSVQFRVDGAGVATGAISGGKASATIKAPAPGHHSLQAVYPGDSQYGIAFSNILPLTTHGAILQISPGSATTIAGMPQDDLHFGFGGDGGPATAAYMHTPNGVAWMAQAMCLLPMSRTTSSARFLPAALSRPWPGYRMRAASIRRALAVMVDRQGTPIWIIQRPSPWMLWAIFISRTFQTMLCER